MNEYTHNYTILLPLIVNKVFIKNVRLYTIKTHKKLKDKKGLSNDIFGF